MTLTMMEDILRHPDSRSAAIDSTGKTYTYGRLKGDICDLSAAFKPRSIMFCLCSNTYASLLGYLTCLSSGAVPLLLDRKIDLEMLTPLIQRYRPAALWVPDTVAGSFFGFVIGIRYEGYTLLTTGYPSAPIHPELALLLSTSGSTGSPKLVRLSMKNIMSNANAIAAYLELDETERPVTTLPMSYTYGLSVIHSHLISGGTLLLTDRSVLEREFWNFFEDNYATSFSGVPATYDILSRIGFFDWDLPSLRYFTQAGGKLSVDMHNRCAAFARQRGLRFYAMYGQTEATARMAYLPWQKSLEKCGSIGIPIPGGSFALSDGSGNEISGSEMVGELVYRGENVSLGYAERWEDFKKGDERFGVLYTGDLAKRDGDGYYYITGRLNRFLKIAGTRISLDECEQIVKDSFPAMDCACCGDDEHLKVFITLHETTKPEAVKRTLCAKLGLTPLSVTVVSISIIPRGISGKILYPELEAKL
jgi:long-chain acyl-CoA synthetase